MNKKIRVTCKLSYKKESEREQINLALKKLKSEGWKIDGPELHSDGLNIHQIYLKKIIKL